MEARKNAVGSNACDVIHFLRQGRLCTRARMRERDEDVNLLGTAEDAIDACLP
jgi:hypothetical protein